MATPVSQISAASAAPATLAPVRVEDSLREAARIAAEYQQAHPESRVEHFLLRTVEVVIGLLALIVSSPIMLAVAIVVKLDTPGPAMFRQQRIAKGGRLFTFYKFRTLYADAKERWPEMYRYQFTPEEIARYRVKRETDPRVTPAGRWLRKSTLDELPNFWNLVKGEVALVGPRPEIPEMLPYYKKEQLIKFAVRPGITGLAQTNGRGNLAFQETNNWDVQYVKTRSLWKDIKIIFRTIRLLTDGSF